MVAHDATDRCTSARGNRRDLRYRKGLRMWTRWLCLTVVAAALATDAPARADQLALPDAHGEPDVQDEAFAVGVLVRGALDHAPVVVVDAQPVALAKATGACAAAGADHLVLVDVARDGVGLRATFAIASATGALQLGDARAGDGDVAGLAAAVVAKIAAAAQVSAAPVPAVSLGQLRPYAAAARDRAEPRAAAAALEDASPATAATVPALRAAMAPVIAAITSAASGVAPEAQVIAARAAGATAALEALAAGHGKAAAAARAFAALDRDDLAAAEAAIGKAPAGALVALVQAALAARRGDDAKLATLLEAGLAGERAHGFAALAGAVAAPRLPAAVERALLAFAARPGIAPEIASRIGAAAAIAGVDADRALALVELRDLAADQADALEPVIRGDTATALRLRAELAMRRDAADAAAPAIAAFAAAAHDDPRAARYTGWQRAAARDWKAAADAFAKAGALRELARAHVFAGDVQRPDAPRGSASAEDFAVVAQLAVDEHRLGDADTALDRAEQLGPLDPAVAHVAIAVAGAHGDDAAVALARRIVEVGAAPPPPPHPAEPAGSGSAASATTGPAATTTTPPASDAGTDPALVRTFTELLAQLPLGRIHRVAVGAMPVHVGWLHAAHDADLAAAFAAALAAARLDTSPIAHAADAGALAEAAVTAGAEAALGYRVDDGSRVELVLVRVGAPAPDVVSAEVPDLVGWNVFHLALIGGVVVLLVVGFGASRAAGRTGLLDVTIEPAPDATEEVYCLEVTDRAARPNTGDLAKFHARTRAAGAVTERRIRTLVGRTTTFKLPTGRWHVHLYGGYERGGTLRPVPDTATKDIEVRRGRTATVAFDLAPSLAELHVQIRGGGKRVTVATSERDKVYADADGRAKLMLPVGHHTLVVEHERGVYRRGVEVPAARVQRLAIDVDVDGEPSAIALGSDAAVSVPGALEPDVRIAFAPAKPKSTAPAPASAGVKELDELIAPVTARTPTPRRGKQPSPAPALAAMIDVELDPPSPAPPPPAVAPAPARSMPALADAPVLTKQESRPDQRLPLEVKLHEKFLDRYLVTAELGRGAMGIVHRALDEKLERDVAIKEMADELRQYPEAMRLFRQEAKALAQLNHTNIVTMYDQVDDGDHVWMIMEYVDGRTLESILDERVHLPWVEALSICDQVSAGLAYAHARKVIHRDVKPGNIFVAKDRIAKLGDFGLARVVREVSNRRTEVRGTPLYMAPEQVKGDDVDARTDLYALGCTLFEMITGRPPFIDGDIVYKHVHEAPPTPASVGASIPPGLEALIMKLLAKSPDDRPSSATELRAAFKDVF
jgi:tRNA A-37 threonylcarbamoyl transferase component Bud32